MCDNFFSFPHWREDEHAWSMASYQHEAFCENLLFFSSYFAVSWIIVNEFCSKAVNFNFFQKWTFFKKHKFWSVSWAVVDDFWSKRIKLGKFLIFAGGSNRPFFGHFRCFLTRKHPNFNIPQIKFGPFLIVIGHEFWLLSWAFICGFYLPK